MKEMTVRLSAARALELAADQAGVELAGLQTVDLNIDSDGLFYIGFQDVREDHGVYYQLEQGIDKCP